MSDESVDKDALQAEFQNITGADAERSQFYLESSGWKLDLAVSSFFENDEPEVMEQSPKPEEAKDKKAEEPGEKPKTSSGPGGIIRFNDSDSDEDGQAFYAGGSSTSGQQILGPPKKKGADFVSEMFKRAKESGAEAVDPSMNPSGSSASSSSAFSGGAFRLGSDETSSQRVEDKVPRTAPPREFTLKMWANGFSIDDGPLREYNDPENREFLKDVMTGKIPRELIREARGGEVHVNMEDHKADEFVKPKATVKPFQGQGMMLGGAVPDIVGAGNLSTSQPSQDPKSAEEEAKKRIPIDDSKPATNIQIRLPDGSRLVVRLNHSHTVGQLREYVTLARPHLATMSFALLTTFPNKELSDDSATVEESKLMNAALLLRPK